MLKKSPFLDKEKIIENNHAFAIKDGFPVSKGHSLIVPKREITSIYDLNSDEFSHFFLLSRQLIKILKNEYNPDAFNIGINNGQYAGQTVAHAHMHIIPRYKGDVKDPKGGVRNIIPDKSGYL